MPDVTDWFSKNSEFRVRIKMMKQPAFPAEPQPDAGCFLQNMLQTVGKTAGFMKNIPYF